MRTVAKTRSKYCSGWRAVLTRALSLSEGVGVRSAHDTGSLPCVSLGRTIFPVYAAGDTVCVEHHSGQAQALQAGVANRARRRLLPVYAQPEALPREAVEATLSITTLWSNCCDSGCRRIQPAKGGVVERRAGTAILTIGCCSTEDRDM